LVIPFVRRGLEALQALVRGHGGPFAVSDCVTMLDLYIVPQLFASRRFQVPLDGLDRLLAIESACAALPEFQRAHPDAQPDRPA
jgi:maleylpyruvate isomerase